MENAISKKDAVLLLSRLVALYLILWALADVLHLPTELSSFLHHGNEHSLSASVIASESHASKVESYWMHYDMLVFSMNVLQIITWLLAAGWFYRCGPRIQKFFGVSTSQKEQSAQLPVSND